MAFPPTSEDSTLAAHIMWLPQTSGPSSNFRSLPVTHSPIAKLPNELLLEIFVFSIPQFELDHDGCRDEKSPNLDTTPWCLTRVCRQWRLIAISCSMLWANVFLPPSLSPSQKQLASTQLLRSADTPLSFYVPLHVRNGQSLLHEFYQNTHRWKCAQIHRKIDGDLLSNATFPLLESIHCHGQTSSPRFPTIEHQRFPRLKSASFSVSARSDANSHQIIFEPTLLSQMTHLAFTGFRYDGIFSVLIGDAPFLRSLALNNINYRSPLDPETLLLPQLRRLSLTEVPDRVIERISCPNLEELAIANFEELGSWTLTSDFQHTLTHLDLWWYPISDILLQFLRLTTNVTHLKLRVLFIEEEEFSDLYMTERLFELLSEKVVCPRLLNFSVYHPPPRPRTTHLIIAFFQFVRARGASMRSASFSVSNDCDETSLQASTKDPAEIIYEKAVQSELKAQAQKLRTEYRNLNLKMEHINYTRPDVQFGSDPDLALNQLPHKTIDNW